MPKSKSPPGHSHASGSRHNNNHKTMQKKVTIKRVKRNKKEVTTKEKILAGLGVGGALMGGVAGGTKTPKEPTRIVSKQNQSSASQKIKSALGSIFGIQKASAATRGEGGVTQTTGTGERPVDERIGNLGLGGGSTTTTTDTSGSGNVGAGTEGDADMGDADTGVSISNTISFGATRGGGGIINTNGSTGDRTAQTERNSQEGVGGGVGDTTTNTTTDTTTTTTEGQTRGDGGGTTSSGDTTSSGTRGVQQGIGGTGTEQNVQEGDHKVGDDGFGYTFYQGQWTLDDGQSRSENGINFGSQGGQWILLDGQTTTREDGFQYGSLSGSWILLDGQTKTEYGHNFHSSGGNWVDEGAFDLGGNSSTGPTQSGDANIQTNDSTGIESGQIGGRTVTGAGTGGRDVPSSSQTNTRTPLDGKTPLNEESNGTGTRGSGPSTQTPTNSTIPYGSGVGGATGTGPGFGGAQQSGVSGTAAGGYNFNYTPDASGSGFTVTVTAADGSVQVDHQHFDNEAAFDSFMQGFNNPSNPSYNQKTFAALAGASVAERNKQIAQYDATLAPGNGLPFSTSGAQYLDFQTWLKGSNPSLYQNIMDRGGFGKIGSFPNDPNFVNAVNNASTDYQNYQMDMENDWHTYTTGYNNWLAAKQANPLTYKVPPPTPPTGSGYNDRHAADGSPASITNPSITSTQNSSIIPSAGTPPPNTPPPAGAVRTPSVNFATSGSNTSPKVGDTWTITVTGNPGDVVTISVPGKGSQNYTIPKDGNGILVLTGTFTEDEIGDWDETVKVNGKTVSVNGNSTGEFKFTLGKTASTGTAATSYGYDLRPTGSKDKDGKDLYKLDVFDLATHASVAGFPKIDTIDNLSEEIQNLNHRDSSSAQQAQFTAAAAAIGNIKSTKQNAADAAFAASHSVGNGIAFDTSGVQFLSFQQWLAINHPEISFTSTGPAINNASIEYQNYKQQMEKDFNYEVAYNNYLANKANVDLLNQSGGKVEVPKAPVAPAGFSDRHKEDGSIKTTGSITPPSTGTPPVTPPPAGTPPVTPPPAGTPPVIPPAAPISKVATLAFNNLKSASSSNFKIGDSWQVVITNAPANAPVYGFGGQDGKGDGYTYLGRTDANGSATLNGPNLTANEIGSWTIKILVGKSGDAQSTNPNSSSLTQVGATLHFVVSPPGNPITPSFLTNVTVTFPGGQVSNLNSSYYATLDTANALASRYGGTVISVPVTFAGGLKLSDNAKSQYFLQFPGGAKINAGVLATYFANNSDSTADTYVRNSIASGEFYNNTAGGAYQSQGSGANYVGKPTFDFITTSGNTSNPKIGETWWMVISGKPGDHVFMNGSRTPVTGSSNLGSTTNGKDFGPIPESGTLIITGQFTAADDLIANKATSYTEIWSVGPNASTAIAAGQVNFTLNP